MGIVAIPGVEGKEGRDGRREGLSAPDGCAEALKRRIENFRPPG